MIRYINVLLFIAMIAVNWLANSLPINNVTTGQLSDSYPNLFVPAGITFSIWGIIYLLLGIFCVFQFTGGNQVTISKIGIPFAITCVLNALWIVAWHYRAVPVSLIIMLLLLATLVFININLKSLQFGILKAAFGIYLGWICIATVANVTALLVNYGWNGFGIEEQHWAISMILTGAVIISFALWMLRNPFAGLAAIWAFAGIAIKRQDDWRSIFLTAIIAIVIVSVATLAAFFRRQISV
jgi:hypothetical protein